MTEIVFWLSLWLIMPLCLGVSFHLTGMVWDWILSKVPSNGMDSALALWSAITINGISIAVSVILSALVAVLVTK